MTAIGENFNGIGMTSTRTRARMVERLREQGIRDEAVLSAMAAVPRHIFVEEALAIRAYEDNPLPIGAGQTISQPYVVARMTELVRSGGTLSKVLEIGTGCGYQTAILAQLAGEVYTVERIGSLVAKARKNLRALKVGGRMVLPLARHDEELKGVQLLTVIEKAPGGIREQTYDAVRFVPLLPGLA